MVDTEVMKDDVTALSSPSEMRSVPDLRSEVKPILPRVIDLVTSCPHGTTVLCVDNSAARLNALKTLLEDSGCDVWTARDLVDALALLESLEFAAMVVDPRGVCLDDEDARLIATIWPQLLMITPHGVLLEPSESAAGQGAVCAVELTPGHILLPLAQSLAGSG